MKQNYFKKKTQKGKKRKNPGNLLHGRERKMALRGIGFVLPSFAGVCIFMLVPFQDVLRRSFTSVATGKFVGWTNYQMVFTNDAFILAGKNTIRFLAIGLPLLLILSLLLAVVLAELGRMGERLKNMFLFPMAVPVVSVAMFWELLFANKGFVNAILHLAGGQEGNWLNTKAAFVILVGSFLWKNLGYDILLWLAGLVMIPHSVYEAAMMDGAGKIRCFFSVTLPNLVPSFFVIAVLSLMNAFKIFREAYLVAGDYPHESIYLMQHLYNNWFRELSIDKMSAAAVFHAIVIGVFVIILRKLCTKDGELL